MKNKISEWKKKLFYKIQLNYFKKYLKIIYLFIFSADDLKNVIKWDQVLLKWKI